MLAALLVSIIFVYDAGSVKGALECSDPSYTLTSSGCYNFFDEFVIRDAAASSCGAHAELVSIANASANREIKEIVEANRADIWLGLLCSANSGEANCTWDDATVLNYTNWMTDIWMGRCVVMKYSSENPALSGKWLTDGCTDKKAFVCKLKDTLPDCTPPFTRSSTNQRCYFFNSTATTFCDARKQCGTMSGALVSIPDGTTNNVVSGRLRNANTTWIGLTAKPDWSTYAWIQGTPYSYENWNHPVYPDSRYGRCVVQTRSSSSEAKWKNVPCTALYPFVCEEMEENRNQQITSPDRCPANNFLSDAGNISSPGYPSYYGPNLSCSYHFGVAPGWRVELKFSSMLLNADDSITIYDSGANTTIWRITGPVSNTSELSFVSTSNLMSLDFASSDSAITNPVGWKASFSTLFTPSTISADRCDCDHCPPQHYQGAGTISSTGYPGNYLNNLNCSYIISVPPSAAVELTLVNFTSERNYDFVKLYDGDSVGSRQIGSWSGPDLTISPQRSTGNKMLVVFATDGGAVYSGWQATYRPV